MKRCEGHKGQNGRWGFLLPFCLHWTCFIFTHRTSNSKYKFCVLWLSSHCAVFVLRAFQQKRRWEFVQLSLTSTELTGWKQSKWHSNSITSPQPSRPWWFYSNLLTSHAGGSLWFHCHFQNVFLRLVYLQPPDCFIIVKPTYSHSRFLYRLLTSSRKSKELGRLLF